MMLVTMIYNSLLKLFHNNIKVLITDIANTNSFSEIKILVCKQALRAFDFTFPCAEIEDWFDCKTENS